MRDTPRRGWQAWRVTLAKTPAEPLPADRFARSRFTAPATGTASDDLIPAAACGETPGPDGIRHALVARVRAAIEAGVYDTDERWRLAEEQLFARMEASV